MTQCYWGGRTHPLLQFDRALVQIVGDLNQMLHSKIQMHLRLLLFKCLIWHKRLNNMRQWLLALLFFTGSEYLRGENNCILSGPMLGHIGFQTARVWVQTQGSCQIVIQFKKEGDESWRSKRVKTVKEAFFTHTFLLDSLEPGTGYIYKLNQGSEMRFETLVDWTYKAPPPELTVAAGSCTYINEEDYDRSGKPYGQSSSIFRSIAQADPDVMLWLGDNTYLRPADVSSKEGIARRYTHTRLDENIQMLLPSCAHYAITDDHDYGPNNANGSYPYKRWIKEVYDRFWPNPLSGTHHGDDLSSYFHRDGIDFFLLDNRTWRQEPDSAASLLGRSQIDWLIENLKYSRSPFKMVAVGGQVLNTVARYENHAVYAAERSYLLNRIVEEQIEGVVFLTGDRHMTELSRFEAENGIVIYDLTLSPLTSSANTRSKDEPNALRVDGTMVNENNYGLLTFSGAWNKRELEVRVFDREGELIWTRKLFADGDK